MRKLNIKPTTSFKMGLVACAFGMVAALLGIFRFGPAAAVKAVQFALTGAMLLFLASSEKGKDKLHTRIKLLLFFLALLISYFDLPLLCPALELLVIPLLYLLYRRQFSLPLPWFFVCLLAELVYAVVRTLVYTPLLGDNALLYTGFALLLVCLGRVLALYQLLKSGVDYLLANPEAYKPEFKNPLRK